MKKKIINLIGIISLISTFWLAGCANKSTNTTSTAPTSTPIALTMGASFANIKVNEVNQFTATGGTPPYTYSVVSGGGIINANTGSYSAPSQPSSVDVKVTDAINSTYDVTITVTSVTSTTSNTSTSSNSTLTLSPAGSSVAVNNTMLFTAGGGVAPYTYSIISGNGSIESVSGLLTAPSSTGYVEVQVQDATGDRTSYTISVLVSTSSTTSSSTTSRAITSCQGIYDISTDGKLGVLTLIEDTNTGVLVGTLAYDSKLYPLSGKCDLATGGVITFNTYGVPQTFNGSFYINPNKTSQIVMHGSYINTKHGGIHYWLAVER